MINTYSRHIEQSLVKLALIKPKLFNYILSQRRLSPKIKIGQQNVSLKQRDQKEENNGEDGKAIPQYNHIEIYLRF